MKIFQLTYVKLKLVEKANWHLNDMDHDIGNQAV